jgi:hypothetical protein
MKDSDSDATPPAIGRGLCAQDRLRSNGGYGSGYVIASLIVLNSGVSTDWFLHRGFLLSRCETRDRA